MNKKTHTKWIINKTALILSMIIITTASIYLLINEQDSHTKAKTLVFTYASPESQGLDNETLTELQETVQGFVENEQIVGAELVIIKNKNIVLHEALGWKNKENNISMEKNTIVHSETLNLP